MTDKEFVLAAAAVSVIKREASVAEKIGIPEQILDEICIKYVDYIDTLELQLGDNGKLSRATETEVKQAVLDAAKYAPAHFKIFD